MAVQSGVYRGMSVEERVAERRARLLEATLTVWSDPEARTTMTAICVTAGLSERYFYESFDSLDDVRVAVLDEIVIELEEARLLAAAEAGADPGTRVRAQLGAFVGILVKDLRKARVALIEAVAVPVLRTRRTQLLRRFAQVAAEEASIMRGHPEGDPTKEMVAGLMFVGGVVELLTAWLDGTLDDTTPEDLVEAITLSFLALDH